MGSSSYSDAERAIESVKETLNVEDCSCADCSCADCSCADCSCEEVDDCDCIDRTVD